jgi:uncharacterized BrkB/YihY/UPF0761 family membrane protein
MRVHERGQVRPRPIAAAAHREEQEWRRAAWTMFWLVALGKLVTMIAIAVVAMASRHPAQRTWGVIVLWNWSWVLLAIVLVAGPALYWLRLRRARRRRAALIYAEWHVD